MQGRAMRTLNIFVSGTIEDQRAERVTVADAIASLRLDATRAETRYSSERCARDECLRMVRECNVYLGVYSATRYGWIIPSDNISVTELEFNEAQRLQKPILRRQVASRVDAAERRRTTPVRTSARVLESCTRFRERQIPCTRI